MGVVLFLISFFVESWKVRLVSGAVAIAITSFSIIGGKYRYGGAANSQLFMITILSAAGIVVVGFLARKLFNKLTNKNG